MKSLTRNNARTNLNAGRIPHCSKAQGSAIIAQKQNEIALPARHGDNHIAVHLHADGRISVNVNGEKFEFTALEAEDLTIDTGNGSNYIAITEDWMEDEQLARPRGH